MKQYTVITTLFFALKAKTKQEAEDIIHSRIKYANYLIDKEFGKGFNLKYLTAVLSEKEENKNG